MRRELKHITTKEPKQGKVVKRGSERKQMPQNIRKSNKMAIINISLLGWKWKDGKRYSMQTVTQREQG